jgi:glutamate carboxypeptidase
VGEVPRGAVAEQALDQGGVHGVAGALGDDVALDAAASECEVADEVKDLVADELVGKAERAVLDRSVGDDDGARVGCAADEAHVAQLGLVFLEAEGAGRGNKTGVVAGFEIAAEAGEADGRRKVDGVVDAVALAGVDADELRALADLDLFEDAEVLAAAALGLEADALEGFHVRQRRPVEDGKLEVVHLDDDVVHAEADERGEQVLGGRDEDRPTHERGGVADPGDVAAVGGDLEAVQVRPAEDDAGAGRRSDQAHGDFGPGVEAYSVELDVGADCLLGMRVLRQKRDSVSQITTGLLAERCGKFATSGAAGRRIEVGFGDCWGDAMGDAKAMRTAVEGEAVWMREATRELVEVESPSEDKAAVNAAVRLVAGWAEAAGGRVKLHRQKEFGDCLEVRFGQARGGAKPVLLLGHLDTVWPMGTLAKMPWREAGGRWYGPGVLDMKAGVVMALAAMRVLGGLNVRRPVTLLLNSEEEVGSPMSREITERLARAAAAVLVLEPAQGLACKTARKGVGAYRLDVHGVAAHSGVDFERGHSAVLELGRMLEKIAAFTDLRIGRTVNAGVIGGGTRSNVIAEHAWAEVDVRIAKAGDAARVERLFRGLRCADRGCSVEVSGGMNRPPMERKAGTAALYKLARGLAAEIGFVLEEAATGGGSDGNFTAALGVATLDGLGAVGEGAHAAQEHVVVEHMSQRTALLAALIAGI